ncbi:sialidase family protein [Bacteroidota bacterium]
MINQFALRLLTGILTLTMGCGKTETADESIEPPNPEVLLNVVHSDSVARLSEGDVEILKDGRLAFVYQQSGRGGGDFDRMDIVLKTSDDGGGNWSQPGVLVSSDEAGMNVMSPTILRTHDGELLLFYLRKNGPQDCRMYVRRSTDELATLSDPVLTMSTDGYFVVNNARPIQLSSGRLIIPAAFHPADGDFEWSDLRMFGIPTIFYSDDVGLSWDRAKTSLDAPPIVGVQLQEPGVVELEDGSLMMWMRTNGGFQYESFSNDRGETWTIPEPGPLAAPLSSATISRIPWTGDLVAVWNDRSGDHPTPEARADYWAVANRTPLTVAVSRDDGLTWSRSRLLENDEGLNFSYPSITFDGQRMIISYSICEFGAYCDMRVTAVDQRWVYGD